MIRRLRRKLIVACMLSLLLVLSSIMGILNVLNYRDIVGDADSILRILKENSGQFPLLEEMYDWRVDGPRYKSPELPFEIRFFSVEMTDAGAVQACDMGQITAVDEDTAREYALRAYESGDERGFVNDYRFVRYADDGGVHIIFLDYGRALSGHRSVLINSILISGAGLLAVFLLMLALSGRIMKPFAENYEKQKLFITDAGHEIKTPITIIDAAAEVLAMEYGENEWLQGIRQQTDRLGKLTGDLIRLSRMEECAALPMMEFPLSELVEEAACAFHPMARAQGKDLQLHIQPGIAWRGHGDSIRQLVSVLLDNAMKYSPEGGAIRLYLERKGRSITLRIENESTREIPREQLERMFDRFYRGDASRSSRMQGYGIGLSIARAIVSAHRGRISASAQGRHLAVAAVFPA